MESEENNSFVDNSSRNASNTDIELDNITLSLSNIVLNASEQNTTANQTEEGQALYQVTPVVVVVLSVFYGAICFVAILGNLLVLCLVMVSESSNVCQNIECCHMCEILVL